MSGNVLERLIVEIDASTAGLRQSLSKGVSDVQSFARKVDADVQRVDQRFAKVGAGLRSAFATFGVGLSVAGIVNFTRSAIQSADAIGEAAAAAGLGAERFQRLGFVFRQNGVSASEFESAMRTSNTRLGQFITTGAGPAAKAIEDLGLKQRIANGEIRTNEQLVDALIGALGNVQNNAQRAALAAAFFGKEIGAKMAAALAVGEKAMESAAEAATGIFSDETVRKGNELADAWERIASAAGNWAKSVAVGVAHDVGNALDIEGLKQPGPEGRLSHLETIQRRRQAIGFDLGPSELVELEDLRAQIANRANFRTGGTMDDLNGPQSARAAGTPADWMRGMRRLDVNNIGDLNARPGLRRPNVQLEELDALQEISAVVSKMPDDLKRWTPEMNAFANALRETRDEVEPLAQEFDAFAAGIGSGLRATLADAFLGIDTSFGDLLRRMTAEMAASGLISLLGSLIPGAGPVGMFLGAAFGGLDKRHSGGPVSSGKPYLVKPDEEIFVPDIAGRVKTVAQARANGGGGSGVTINVTNNAAPHVQTTARESGPGMYEIAVSLVQEAFGSGKMDPMMNAKYGLGTRLGAR